jgi:hypothetical protein
MIDFFGYALKMLLQHARRAGQIGMIAEHGFFGNCVIKLGGMAILAKENVQRIIKLFAYLFFCEEIVTPRLRA